MLEKRQVYDWHSYQGETITMWATQIRWYLEKCSNWKTRQQAYSLTNKRVSCSRRMVSQILLQELHQKISSCSHDMCWSVWWIWRNPNQRLWEIVFIHKGHFWESSNIKAYTINNKADHLDDGRWNPWCKRFHKETCKAKHWVFCSCRIPKERF